MTLSVLRRLLDRGDRLSLFVVATRASVDMSTSCTVREFVHLSYLVVVEPAFLAIHHEVAVRYLNLHSVAQLSR